MAELLSSPATVEGPEDFASDGPGIYSRWDAELRLAMREMEDYRERCRKIVRRYRLESEVDSEIDDAPEGLQLLWSTVQTQIPAIYQFPPQVEVSRRFKAKDSVARVASSVLERYLQVEIDRDRFSNEVLAVLLDRCLCGQGQMWVEYEPVLGKVREPVAVVQQPDGSFVTAGGAPYAGPPPQPSPQGGPMMGEQEFDALVDCRAPAVHLDLEDFLHSPARRWREVRWVARRHYYTRDECVQMFGAGMEKYGWDPQRVPLTAKARGVRDDEGAQADLFKRAEVWQIWDDQAVYYIARGMGVPLDVRKRPLALVNTKWPCPLPLYGTMTNGTMVPVPDFVQWQGLAEEVDDLTARIAVLTRALKIAGARPSSVPELDRVLTEEDVLVPVDNWAAFAEKGGIKGMLSFMPMAEISEVLTKLQEQRRERIDYIYQINGIGDILRGQGDPRATATQETIKARYGSLRLGQMQHDLAQFVERVLEIKAEIICEKAPPEVLANVSAIEEIRSEQQFIGPALQMLKDARVRDLRIDVDERSMVAIQDAEEKGARMEFLQAFAPLLDKATAASQQSPEMGDVIAETMLFGVRGFRVGRDMEGTFEQYLEAMSARSAQAREQQKNNPPPPPLPLLVEQTRAQNAANLERERHQNKMAEIATQANNEAQKERAQAISEAAIEQYRAESKERVAQTEAQLEQALATMQHQFDMALEAFKAQLEARAQEREAAAAERDAMMQKMLKAPRRRRITQYDDDGMPVEAMDEIIEGEGDRPDETIQ